MSKRFCFILMSQLILKIQAAQSAYHFYFIKCSTFKMIATIKKTPDSLRQLRSVRYAQHTPLFGNFAQILVPPNFIFFQFSVLLGRPTVTHRQSEIRPYPLSSPSSPLLTLSSVLTSAVALSSPSSSY